MNAVRFVPWATAIAMLVATSFAQAATIYYEDFSGTGVALNGTTPNVSLGGGTWQAAPAYLDNGAVSAGASYALLPFTPVDGTVYTLEATTTVKTAQWIAVGFASANNVGTTTGANARFSNAGTPGYAWILNRNDAALPNQQAFNGARTTNTPTPITTEVAVTVPVDFKIILDTTGGAGLWTAEYFVNGNNMSTGPQALVAGASGIAYVGFSMSGGIAGTDDGSLQSFKLSVIPEPSSAVLGLLSVVGIVIIRLRHRELGTIEAS